MIHPAWMSRQLENNVVECLACNHKCKIPPGKRGICGIRKNENGELKLLVYGKAVSYNTDPIEKKPLFHFYPGTGIFSFGTVGCNFHCLFCQNWDISQFHKDHTEEDIINSGKDLMPETIVEYCKSNNIPSIAFTYNEPGIFFEYTYDTAKLAHENGIKTVYVSNGFETQTALKKLLPYIDAMNIDLKSFSNDFYLKICGGRIDPVKKNIKWLFEKGVWDEVTTLLVTGENDSDKELEKIAKFIYRISPNIPWHISRYTPCYKMNNPPTPVERLEKAYEIGKNAGLNYVYVGNINDPAKSSTYCPKCKTCVIERTDYGYSVNSKLKKGGICPVCGYKIAGRFD